MSEKKAADRQPPYPPQKDFEKSMGPLGRKWHDGGCVRVFLLGVLVAALAAYGASLTRMFR